MKLTKDNFAQVLEFNEFKLYKGHYVNNNNLAIYIPDQTGERYEIIPAFDYIDSDKVTVTPYFDICLLALSKLIELKELPDFDYLSFALLNNLPTTLENGEHLYFQKTITNTKYKPTKQNAEIVLKIKKLMDTLERA